MAVSKRAPSSHAVRAATARREIERSSVARESSVRREGAWEAAAASLFLHPAAGPSPPSELAALTQALRAPWGLGSGIVDTDTLLMEVQYIALDLRLSQKFRMSTVVQFDSVNYIYISM